MGDFNVGDLGDAVREQVEQMKKQIGDQNQDLIRDAVARARDEVRRAAQQMRTFAYNTNGGLARTTIDMKNAQIVLSDDKGELRVENVDGKRMLTANDPQGKLLFSGPVETKEEIDKVPADVRQRFEKLQQRDLPAMAPQNPGGPNEIDNDDDATTPSIITVSCEQPGSARLDYRGESSRLSLL
ncbi:MAG: hypothetical protein M3R59_05955 [Verrucomicrobiota bacterium]|nr:hypothetical protein [Verrucomicrobiota bacterium]